MNLNRWLLILMVIVSSAASANPASNAKAFAPMLPVKTPSLTPGKVPKGTFSTHLDKPLFIVGADRRSHRWLARHHAYLKSINAMGMVVNVANTGQLKRLMSYGLPLYPVQGRQWADQFSLSHYPVLLENGEIKQ